MNLIKGTVIGVAHSKWDQYPITWIPSLLMCKAKTIFNFDCLVSKFQKSPKFDHSLPFTFILFQYLQLIIKYFKYEEIICLTAFLKSEISFSAISVDDWIDTCSRNPRYTRIMFNHFIRDEGDFERS